MWGGRGSSVRRGPHRATVPDVEDVSQWVAAGAAVIAAGVVAWQSWETRKSAKASQAAVEVANRTLDVAQDEEEHSRELIREAYRSNIDQIMPAITVSLRDLQWPPTLADHPQSTVFNHGQDTALRLPRDQGVWVILECTARIRNDSDVACELRVSSIRVGDVTLTDEVGVLEPRTYRDVTFAVPRVVKAWVEHERGINVGGSIFSSPLSVVYTHPADTGADDNWNVECIGNPLVPIPDETDSYDVAPAAPDYLLRVAPRSRRYWLSRENTTHLSHERLGS